MVKNVFNVTKLAVDVSTNPFIAKTMVLANTRHNIRLSQNGLLMNSNVFLRSTLKIPNIPFTQISYY